MQNTWADRDLPVLDAIVQHLDDAAGTEWPYLSDIAEATSLDLKEVTKAAYALESDQLIDLQRSMGGPDSWTVKSVSGEARRMVGQWPTAEQFVDELVRRLQAAADGEPDEERRGRLRELASAAGGVARNVFVDVTAAVITRQMGG
ncbi:hypothetical protein [Streptomyces sp. NPDC006668]|uniref:hypothetical protein n=1 Tax=Streptomyces sp. NPDC006668 TaxID=3156903 RepID=UPI0033F9C6A7